MSTAALHGLAAEFVEPDAVLRAAQAAYAQGYRRMDAYTPYHVEGLAAALGMRRNAVSLITLLGALGGALTGYGMQWYSATLDYPLNVGGRPYHSWPAFVPITFELTILGGALSAVLGMLVLNGLPRPHHAIFETPHFAERNASRFYLCVEAADPLFDPVETDRFLRAQTPAEVWEVPA